MFKSHKFRLLKSRAVSTVIGGLIFIVILAAAFAAFITMMNVNTNFLQTQIKISELAIAKTQEQFTMGAAYDSTDANKLCVSIQNTGATPLQMMDLLIINKTAGASNTVNRVDIDPKDAFIPVGLTGGILDNTRLTMNTGTYSIKAVTASGIMKTTDLRVFSGTGADPRLNVTVFAYPISIASGQNLTVGMHVFNVGNTTLLQVQPNGNPTVQPAEAVQSFKLRTTPSIISRLEPHEDTLFQWDPELTGGVGSIINFTASAKAKVQGCSTSSFITSQANKTQVKIVPGVRRQILASPETFLTFPNPFGQSAAKTGVFAMVIQNPTNNAFSVPQVAIQIVTPSTPDPIKSLTAVTPATGWSVSSGRVIKWTNVGTPVIVKPNSIVQFIVRAEPGTQIADSPINAVFSNVYSSYGQFGKGPFTLGTTSADSTILNVYANTTFATGGAEGFTIPNIPTAKTGQRFNFTISNSGKTAIDSGAFMLINVPPGLRDIANVSNGNTVGDGLNSGLEIRGLLKFADGSSQIPIKLTSNLVPGGKASYSFRATMPSISVPAFYTLTVLANGTTNTNTVLVGPLSETVLQVCPTGGCP